MQSENINTIAAEEIPEGLTEVGRFTARASADDHALVILAMGLPYWLFVRDDSFQLCVETTVANAALEQLALFDVEETRRAREAVVSPAESHEGSAAALVAVAAILGVMFVASHDKGSVLIDRGLLDANAVVSRGEWWRTITALTLHADLPHVLANLAGAALFGHFAARRFGAGFAWLLILLSGALGNLATACIYRQNGHLSLGASTAIFGALGLLAGAGVAPRTRLNAAHRDQPSSPFQTLMAALILLALLGGASSAHTDIVAHLAGFVAGGLLGFFTGIAPIAAVRGTWQKLMALAALGLIATAWAASLQNAPG